MQLTLATNLIAAWHTTIKNHSQNVADKTALVKEAHDRIAALYQDALLSRNNLSFISILNDQAIAQNAISDESQKAARAAYLEAVSIQNDELAKAITYFDDRVKEIKNALEAATIAKNEIEKLPESDA